VRRGALALLVAMAAGLAGGVAGAPRAEAHTIGGVAATNYRSEITSMTPRTPGVTVRVRDLGRRLELENRTGEDVVVAGYQSEPYLRVGPAGVFENVRSPSLYQNKVAPGSSSLVELPEIADPLAPPEWRRRGGGDSVSWRDHRARWEGDDPPAVRANPGKEQVVVPRWSVELRKGAGQSPIVVAGRISWAPGPAVWPWLVATLALFGLALAAGSTRRWWVALSALLAVFLAVDMVRLYGSATQGGGSVFGGLVQALGLGVLEVLAWGAGAWAIGAIQRQRAVGVYAAMAVGLSIGFVSGVGDLLNLAYSQVPTALPTPVARAAVTVCLGVGFGLAAGGFVALRKQGPVLPGISTAASRAGAA